VSTLQKMRENACKVHEDESIADDLHHRQPEEVTHRIQVDDDRKTRPMQCGRWAL